MNIKTSLTIPLVVTLAFFANAQRSPVAAGGSVAGSNGSVSYSIGQPVCTTLSNDKGIVSQGVQQVYIDDTGTGINSELIDVAFSAYPNPTSDLLQLTVPAAGTSDYSYRLYNLKGDFLKAQRLNASKTTISLADYTPGVYLLKIFNKKSLVKSYKIIKK